MIKLTALTKRQLMVINHIITLIITNHNLLYDENCVECINTYLIHPLYTKLPKPKLLFFTFLIFILNHKKYIVQSGLCIVNSTSRTHLLPNTLII